MNKSHYILGAIAVCAMGSTLAVAQQPPAPPQAMSFFVTSSGSGKGADLGGVAGADAICQARAVAAGSTKTFHAYLSTQSDNPRTVVNARDRIGLGPWYNAKGQLVARSLQELHGDTLELARLGANVSKASVLTEKGDIPKGFGDQPNQHDMMTGSRPDGTAAYVRTPPTIRAITGLRAPPARRNSATSTAPAGETLPGTQPTPRAAAARKVWSPPAARATFIASPLTDRRFS